MKTDKRKNTTFRAMIFLSCCILLGVIWLALRGRQATAANEAYQRCLKLEVGISKSRVLEVMGKPDRETVWEHAEVQGYTQLAYNNPPEWSESNSFFVNPITDKVDYMHCDETERKGQLDPRVKLIGRRTK